MGLEWWFEYDSNGHIVAFELRFKWNRSWFERLMNWLRSGFEEYSDALWTDGRE